jgi:hypothetical protein
MISKPAALRILFLCCASMLPTMAWGDGCSSTTVSNLLGTSCSIGDVNYTFGSAGFTSDSVVNGVSGAGIAASSLIFTPDATNPLDPSFTITGPLSVTASGAGNSTGQSFTLLWTATATTSAVAFGSATNTINNAAVPVGPNFGLVIAGNNFGDPTFTNAIVQSGGPNTNPSSAGLDSLSSIPLDGLFVGLFVSDGTGAGATASAQGLSYQYDMVEAMPEPAPSILLSVGLLGFLLIEKLMRSHNKRMAFSTTR